MMSTPNMSFDSPIIVAKSGFSGIAKTKDSNEPPTKEAGDSLDVNSSDTKDSKQEDEKRTKKKDMFAPEADMFADEYSVSCFSFLVFITMCSKPVHRYYVQ